MNLQNLNLVELNAQEKREVDGGRVSVIIINPHTWECLANAGLAVLGCLAGIGDGIRAGMK